MIACFSFYFSRLSRQCTVHIFCWPLTKIKKRMIIKTIFPNLAAHHTTWNNANLRWLGRLGRGQNCHVHISRAELCHLQVRDIMLQKSLFTVLHFRDIFSTWSVKPWNLVWQMERFPNALSIHLLQAGWNSFYRWMDEFCQSHAENVSLSSRRKSLKNRGRERIKNHMSPSQLW